jgi:hypothetical protein
MVAFLDTAVLFILTLPHLVVAFTPNFNNYPAESISCLTAAAEGSGCNEEATLEAANACFCSNCGNWITNSAKCIAANDPNDLSNVWDVMVSNCEKTNTPVTLTRKEFFAAAKSGWEE